GSDFDTIIAVYSGSTLGGLGRIVFNDDVQDGVIRTSSVTFNANSGTVYRIAIDGWGGEQGTIKLNWSCAAPSPTPTPIVFSDLAVDSFVAAPNPVASSQFLKLTVSGRNLGPAPVSPKISITL